ncbi:hypothetical protein PR048_006192 [Dryococelus australis]|uniref:Uncharacterized protein n=1 Tax=Dryococelus australis TaxID=614101 RepID=A0ABQ9IAA6_9NEOP|nr:hypothetical protein PR048_006192 [Dryococelus australis]
MDDTSGRRTDKLIRPAKEINKFLKPKPKKVSKLKYQPRDDSQLDMTNRYDSLSDTDRDKDTDQPEPKKKEPKQNMTIPYYKTELLHKIDEINRTTVYWEEYQPRTDDIPQCANCQKWGHTKHNCAWPARFIKCKQEKPEEHHHTKSCLKPATIPAHCVNCKGPHPANYKQCPSFLAAKNSRPK